MKKIFKISAAVLAAGVAGTLAGCAGCAGCAGSTTNNTVTNSNWYTGTSYAGIQPSFILSEEHPEYTEENIVYDVAFDASSASNKYYSVNYKDGSFSTEFYATYYDWQSSDRYQVDKQELVYYYKTEFKISVQFTMASGEASDWLNDSVTTECYFRAAGMNLQPVYSKQVIKSTSPATNKPTSLQDAYSQVDVTYENYYSFDCSAVTTVIDEAGKEKDSKTYSLQNAKTSVFDNSSLYIAMRSMKLSTTFTQAISLYSAAAGGVSSYTVSGSETALGSEERKDISSALAEKGLYTPVTEDKNGKPVEDAGVNSVAMNINYTGGKLTGTTQTVWYAAVENQDNNTARATMLKLSIPLSYNLGTLNFTLKNVVSTLWNN